MVNQGQLDGVGTVSVVIPVYRGATTIVDLIEEIRPFFSAVTTPAGHRFRVSEVILVDDNGPDGSDRVIAELVATVPEVRSLRLSRNFGQHAATIAGMSSSTGDWIATIDEDGQHDPAALPSFVDEAIRTHAGVVYARPTNPAPHGAMRNLASRASKSIMSMVIGSKGFREYQSYRLVRGEVGRHLAEFAASGVYLDVALGWITDRVASVPVLLRAEGERPSGYSVRSLFAHFWRMVLSSGTRGLRAVSILGVTLAAIGIVIAGYLVIARLLGQVSLEGWTSLAVITLICSGALLLSLGIVAEYIGVTLNVAMGRPLYLVLHERRPAGEDAVIAPVSAPSKGEHREHP